MLGQQVELADKITDAQNELHIAKQQYIDHEIETCTTGR